MKKPIVPYRVLLWDVNRQGVEYYDIMPYLIDTYDSERKRKNGIFSTDLDTLSGIREFILNACKYRFWSRCEYEILIGEFPPTDKRVKIDAYSQIESNIDVIAEHFYNHVKH